MKKNALTVLFQSVGVLIALFLIGAAALYRTATAPITIAQSIAHSTPSDNLALVVEHLVKAHVQISKHVTILYLNPYDLGDNFYRVRYALYPIQFVPYWTWTRPNQGGHVWTLPVFNTEHGLKKIMLDHHVNYVIAVDGPRLLDFLHRHGSKIYIFHVNQNDLHAGKTLDKSLVEVTKWP